MVLTMKDPDGPDRIVVTHPPPAPIMSVASVLRYDTYKALIETHGDDARNALPGVKLQGPKTKNPHSGEMCHRIESRDKVKEWEDNDWWEVAALASGMQPNEIAEYVPLGQEVALKKLEESSAEMVYKGSLKTQRCAACGDEKGVTVEHWSKRQLAKIKKGVDEKITCKSCQCQPPPKKHK